MRIILLQDIHGVGRRGDVKAVSDGYAKNYLLPRNIAKLATPAAMKKREHELAQIAEEESLRLTHAKQEKEKIEALEMHAVLETGEGKAVFGSIRQDDIAEYLRTMGIEVTKQAIELPQPIKKIGDYTVPIALHPEISATLKVKVTPPPQSSPSGESRQI